MYLPLSHLGKQPRELHRMQNNNGYVPTSYRSACLGVRPVHSWAARDLVSRAERLGAALLDNCSPAQQQSGSIDAHQSDIGQGLPLGMEISRHAPLCACGQSASVAQGQTSEESHRCELSEQST